MSERFLLRRDRVVQAGAGTGKTHALLTQYLHLCAGLSARGAAVEPRALCALTFTEKAAGELRERLQRRTAAIASALATAESTEERAAALQQLGETDLLQTAAAIERPLPGLELWEKVLTQLPAAAIGTFHSFAASLLRRHAAIAGLDPDFTLLDEDSARALLVETSERVVLGALEGRLADAADSVPVPPAVSPQAAALVVSEYGFSGGPSAEGGAVEALCRLYQLRGEEGKDAAGLADSYREPALLAELMALREGLRASVQTLARLAEQLGAGSAEREAELRELAEPLLLRLHELDADSLGAALPLYEQLAQGVKKLRAKKDAPGAQEELALVRARIKAGAAEARALHASLRAAPLALALESLLMPLAAAYGAAKEAVSALDFTDLLRKARDLLRDHAGVRAETQARFAVLLVDEFQDTNPLQAELLELLAGGRGNDGPRPTEPGRLYIVGDRKQSIYEFRGADVAAYTLLCDKLVAAGADQETLSRSYRSRPAVLDLVRVLFAAVMRGDAANQSAAPAFFVRWDEQRDPLQAVRPPDPTRPLPVVELVRGAEEPPAEAEPEVAAPAANAAPAVAPIDAEADLLAQRILALHADGERLGDMVVLLRRYTHLGRYTLALKRAGVAHYVIRGRGFFQAQEVLDLTALLTLICDPEDRLALLTLLRSPLCGLSDDSVLQLHLSGRLALAALLHEVPQGSAGQALLGEAPAAGLPAAGLPADEAARLVRLLRLVQVLLRLGDQLGPSACLQAIYDHTDLLAVLAADADGEQRVANLLRLQERARAFDSRGGLRAFVRALRLATDPQLKTVLASPGDEPEAQIAGETDDVVRIMTVHQAKGLEFPIVLVAGCTTRERVDVPAVAYDRAVGLGLTIYEDGERIRTLAARRVDESARLRASAESARLFYVAATRARERLIFLGETGARPRLAGTWRAHLDALLLEQAGVEPPLLAEWRPGPPPPASPPAVASSSEALLGAARAAVAVAYAEPRLRPPGGSAEEAPLLTGAAATDLLVCPRRYHLRTTARLFPPGPAARPALSEEAAGEPVYTQLRRGSLAGQLLAQLDAAADDGELEALLLIAGVDIELPPARELRAHLQRFIGHLRRSGGTLAALARAGTLASVQRAVPYSLELAGGALRLTGILDLVHVQDGAEGRTVTVLDYHYCCAPMQGAEQEGLLLAQRRALLALVASALHPAASRLRTGLCFLREADAEPVLRPSAPDEPAATAQALARAAPQTQLTLQAALRLPVLPASTCDSMGCEYAPLCHRRSH